MTRLYAQILKDPANSDLNFRYAQLAEQRGEPRKALAAYERILVNDPNNPEVRKALQRIRRKLQPNTTLVSIEIGTAWESNPRRVSSGQRGDLELLARASVRDERRIGDIRWRTLGNFVGEAHRHDSDLNYGFAGASAGPVIDLTPTLAVHAALGGAISYFDHRTYYREGNASLTFESYLEGAFRTIRFRSGYRDFNDFFPSDQGFYADVTGKFSQPNVIASGDVFIIAPWFRWSGFSGSGFSVVTPTQEVEPGKYIEYGGKLEYYRRLTEWLTLGSNIALTHRTYSASPDIVTGISLKRRDLLLAPGATAIIHNVFRYQTDLRFDYRYDHNDSNFALRDFSNHAVTMMLVSRF